MASRLGTCRGLLCYLSIVRDRLLVSALEKSAPRVCLVRRFFSPATKSRRHLNQSYFEHHHLGQFHQLDRSRSSLQAQASQTRTFRLALFIDVLIEAQLIGHRIGVSSSIATSPLRSFVCSELSRLTSLKPWKKSVKGTWVDRQFALVMANFARASTASMLGMPMCDVVSANGTSNVSKTCRSADQIVLRTCSFQHLVGEQIEHIGSTIRWSRPIEPTGVGSIPAGRIFDGVFLTGVVELVPEVERVPLKKKTRAMSSASEAVKNPDHCELEAKRITISRSPSSIDMEKLLSNGRDRFSVQLQGILLLGQTLIQLDYSPRYALHPRWIEEPLFVIPTQRRDHCVRPLLAESAKQRTVYGVRPHRAASAKLLEEEVFGRWGYPQSILSDNSPQFRSLAWKQACEKWQCRLYTTAIYSPRANPTERRNQEIKKGLRLHLMGKKHNQWDLKLPSVLYDLRCQKNAATGVTPAHLLLGKELSRPGDWKLQLKATAIEERHLRVTQAQLQQAKYQAKYASVAQNKVPIKSGDLVYTKTHPLSNAAERYHAGFEAKWEGPFAVTDQLSEDVFVLDKYGSPTKTHRSELSSDPTPTTVQSDQTPTTPGSDPTPATPSSDPIPTTTPSDPTPITSDSDQALTTSSSDVIPTAATPEKEGREKEDDGSEERQPRYNLRRRKAVTDQTDPEYLSQQCLTVVSSDPVRHCRKAIENIKAYFQLRRRKFGEKDVTSKVVYNAGTCRSRRTWPYLPLPTLPRPKQWTRTLPPTTEELACQRRATHPQLSVPVSRQPRLKASVSQKVVSNPKPRTTDRLKDYLVEHPRTHPLPRPAIPRCSAHRERKPRPERRPPRKTYVSPTYVSQHFWKSRYCAGGSNGDKLSWLVVSSCSPKMLDAFILRRLGAAARKVSRAIADARRMTITLSQRVSGRTPAVAEADELLENVEAVSRLLLIYDLGSRTKLRETEDMPKATCCEWWCYCTLDRFQEPDGSVTEDVTYIWVKIILFYKTVRTYVTDLDALLLRVQSPHSITCSRPASTSARVANVQVKHVAIATACVTSHGAEHQLAVGELWAFTDPVTRPEECVLAAHGVRAGSGVYDRRAFCGSGDRVRYLAGLQLPNVNAQEVLHAQYCKVPDASVSLLIEQYNSSAVRVFFNIAGIFSVMNMSSALAVGELWAFTDPVTRPEECVLAAHGVRAGSGVYDRRAFCGSGDRVRYLAGLQLPNVNAQEEMRRKNLGEILRIDSRVPRTLQVDMVRVHVSRFRPVRGHLAKRHFRLGRSCKSKRDSAYHIGRVCNYAALDWDSRRAGIVTRAVYPWTRVLTIISEARADGSNEKGDEGGTQHDTTTVLLQGPAERARTWSQQPQPGRAANQPLEKHSSTA
ncbi:unnamed protein product, partial [Trichogramma brassicae]